MLSSKITSSESLANSRQTKGGRKREEDLAEKQKCPHQGIGPAFYIWPELKRVCCEAMTPTFIMNWSNGGDIRPRKNLFPKCQKNFRSLVLFRKEFHYGQWVEGGKGVFFRSCFIY